MTPTCKHKRWFHTGSNVTSPFTILDFFECRCGRRRATGWRGANKVRFPGNLKFKKWVL